MYTNKLKREILSLFLLLLLSIIDLGDGKVEKENFNFDIISIVFTHFSFSSFQMKHLIVRNMLSEYCN